MNWKGVLEYISLTQIKIKAVIEEQQQKDTYRIKSKITAIYPNVSIINIKCR